MPAAPKPWRGWLPMIAELQCRPLPLAGRLIPPLHDSLAPRVGRQPPTPPRRSSALSGSCSDHLPVPSLRTRGGRILQLYDIWRVLTQPKCHFVLTGPLDNRLPSCERAPRSGSHFLFSNHAKGFRHGFLGELLDRSKLTLETIAQTEPH